MADHFPHGIGVGGDDEAAAGHGFKEGPGEDEGIGQVGVHRGDLQGFAVGGVGDLAEEVHAGKVDGVFAQQFAAPVVGVLRTAAVTHVVAANDQYLAGGMLLEDQR